jgi:hypothetical protein
MDARYIWGFIEKNKGLHARDFLEYKLSNFAAVVECSLGRGWGRESDGDLISLLDAHGPAFVYALRVSTNTPESTGPGPAGPSLLDPLFDVNTHVHVGGDGDAVDTKRQCWHEVVLIGYRVTHDGVRYLVQNCWTGKQFFEVDLAFLASRDARLVWVTSNTLTALPAGLPVTHGPYKASASSWGSAITPERMSD